VRVVVALGGNALLRRGQPLTAQNQRDNARVACRALAPVAIGLICHDVSRGLSGVRPVWRERVLWLSSPDASRLLMTRALRGLADGLVSVLLAAHLGALGLSTFAVMGTPRIGAGLRSAA